MKTILSNDHILSAKIKSSRFISIPAFQGYPELLHGFTTRNGGVSSGDYASLNLNFNRPDPKSNVKENFRLLGEELGVLPENMVLSYQVHLDNVMPVTAEHKGMGVVKERSYRDIDGLMTQTPGLLLVTCYADCVPLYFYDPFKKAIAVSHSGWKGTLLDIAGETIKGLQAYYNSNPQDLRVAFGPHIGDCCFEVDFDVAQQFLDAFSWAAEFSAKRDDGKWLLDLEGIITESLVRHGVVRDNISGCEVCTRCEKELFFSHRGMNGKTGTGAAFMMIRG